MDANLDTIGKLYNAVAAFAVAYGFQILGALVVLVVGLKLASWAGGRVMRFSIAKSIDPSLARFIGNVAKLVIVVCVIIITLGNFGISVAPLIALAGAGAFGATMAIQGPLSNYGAGVSILLGRLFAVGDTITVAKVSGVVEDVTLAVTLLIGEDGERITIPNKDIVGQVIVNSADKRIIESRIAIGFDEDSEAAIAALRQALQTQDSVAKTPVPLIGIQDFTYGGVVLGLRYWVPSRHYYEERYAINRALLAALRGAGISLMPADSMAIAAPSLTGDDDMTKN